MTEADLLECADFDLSCVREHGEAEIPETTRGPLVLAYVKGTFVLSTADGEEVARGDAEKLRTVLADLYDVAAMESLC